MGLDFMVVGSTALQICGIPLREEPHDIDIEVATIMKFETTENLFKDLEYLYKCENDITTPSYKNKPFVFKIGETIINAWVVNTFSHQEYITWSDIKVATVSSVLLKKCSYQRIKDYKDMNYIIQTFSEMMDRSTDEDIKHSSIQKKDIEYWIKK